MLVGEGDFSGAGNELFFAAGQRSSFINRVYPKRQVWEKGQVSPYMVGAPSTIKGVEHFGKTEDTGGIIDRDNFPGHCFVLRDLLPMNFFK